MDVHLDGQLVDPELVVVPGDDVNMIISVVDALQSVAWEDSSWGGGRVPFSSGWV